MGDAPQSQDKLVLEFLSDTWVGSNMGSNMDKQCTEFEKVDCN